MVCRQYSVQRQDWSAYYPRGRRVDHCWPRPGLRARLDGNVLRTSERWVPATLILMAWRFDALSGYGGPKETIPKAQGSTNSWHLGSLYSPSGDRIMVGLHWWHLGLCIEGSTLRCFNISEPRSGNRNSGLELTDNWRGTAFHAFPRSGE